MGVAVNSDLPSPNGTAAACDMAVIAIPSGHVRKTYRQATTLTAETSRHFFSEYWNLWTISAFCRLTPAPRKGPPLPPTRNGKTAWHGSRGKSSICKDLLKEVVDRFALCQDHSRSGGMSAAGES